MSAWKEWLRLMLAAEVAVLATQLTCVNPEHRHFYPMVAYLFLVGLTLTLLTELHKD